MLSCLSDVFPNFGTYNKEDKSITKGRSNEKNIKLVLILKMFLQKQLIPFQFAIIKEHAGNKQV